MTIPEPAAKRTTLAYTAAVVWLIVGTYLFIRGLLYHYPIDLTHLFYLFIAILIGIAKGTFLFRKIILKNIKRINELAPHKDKVCVFAFQAVQSYLLVLLMISGGHTLRLFVTNNTVLFIIYSAIGTALLTGSVIYFKSIDLVHK